MSGKQFDYLKALVVEDNPHMRELLRTLLNALGIKQAHIVGASMGLHHDDHFKRLKIMQDADAIVADCQDMIAARGIDPALAREVVVKAMLADQPLPLRGSG